MAPFSLKMNRWKLVQKNIQNINEEKTHTDEEQVDEKLTRPKGWGKVREEYVGKNKVIVNDVNHDCEANVEDEADKQLPFNKMSFFNVVKEAAATEKKKKERPSLLKFLEKFDSVELPQSETPNPSQEFSFFDQDPNLDRDTEVLKNGIQLVSGSRIRELATPTYTVTAKILFTVVTKYF